MPNRIRSEWGYIETTPVRSWVASSFCTKTVRFVDHYVRRMYNKQYVRLKTTSPVLAHCAVCTFQNYTPRTCVVRATEITQTQLAMMSFEQSHSCVFSSHLLLLIVSSPFLFSPPPTAVVVATQIRGGSHNGLFSPLPSKARALQVYREKIRALSSLVDSRRIVPTHATRSQQWILFFFFYEKIQNPTAGFELQDQHY